jgi:hypothetical protein
MAAGGGRGIGRTQDSYQAASYGHTNKGGGGGGGGSGNRWDGQSVGLSSPGNGGSGKVIIRYFGQPKSAGGTITETGGWTFHTFTSSGTFTA